MADTICRSITLPMLTTRSLLKRRASQRAVRKAPMPEPRYHSPLRSIQNLTSRHLTMRLRTTASMRWKSVLTMSWIRWTPSPTRLRLTKAVRVMRLPSQMTLPISRSILTTKLNHSLLSELPIRPVCPVHRRRQMRDLSRQSPGPSRPAKSLLMSPRRKSVMCRHPMTCRQKPPLTSHLRRTCRATRQGTPANWSCRLRWKTTPRLPNRSRRAAWCPMMAA